jgi:alkanesulfonate monooxygenase SsuD/methylene tetrahydromethanopterin reductase-like flavin-dependent oxidoreductase (luciferase family)
MHFGYFFTAYGLNGESFSEVLDRAIGEAKLAEDSGFDSVWLSEHHFGGPEGWDIHPNPVLTGTYLAAVTERIRIGMAAVILPNWHPLRLAEDIALLDHLSGGRVECGVGRGITNRELSNLNGFGADRRDPDRNWAYFLESVEILKAAWTQDPFTWKGEFFEFPTPGVKDSYAAWHPGNPLYRSADDEYIGMSITPRPLQTPHPPLWNTVDQTPGFRVAAEHGLKPMSWLRSPKALKEAFEAYRETASEVQGRELRLGEDCSLMRTSYVAETFAEARAIAEPAIERLYAGYLGGIRGRQIYAEPGEVLDEAAAGQSWFDFLYERQHLLVGTPDMVADQIAELRDTVGLEHMLMYNWLPGLTADQTKASLELFAEQVMPRFSGASATASAARD